MRREAGFVLLEMLVAFAIAALALALLYHGGVEGLNGTRLAARSDEAVARARSRLEALCHGARLTPGSTSGNDGSGFVWHSDIGRAASLTIARGNAGAAKPALQATLFTVRVSVSWPGTFQPHRVSLATDCIGLTEAAERP